MTLLATMVGAYVALCVFLFVAQRNMIYFPPRSTAPSPHAIELPTEAGPVKVLVHPGSGSRAVLYFGGNAEDVAHSHPELLLGFPQHTVYLLRYRGYGDSAGSPTETGLFADAEALFDRVQREHSDIVVVGRSLGSGVAAHLASVRPVRRLVLVTPFDSLMAVAADHYRAFPVRWLLRDKYESWRRAPAISASTLLIVAEHDEIIPRERSEALLAHFKPGVARLRVIGGADHNSISERPEYALALMEPP